MARTTPSFERGFSLLEVGLALSISLLAVVAMVAIFDQTKNSAQDAAMRGRLTSLQAVVENLFNQQGTYPALDDTATAIGLRTAWHNRHPNDWNASPYGGTLNQAGNAPNLWWGIGGAPWLTAGNSAGSGAEFSIGPGGMYYFRVVTPGVPNISALPIANGTARVWQTVPNGWVNITGYGVAGVKFSMQKYWMVTSGR